MLGFLMLMPNFHAFPQKKIPEFFDTHVSHGVK